MAGLVAFVCRMCLLRHALALIVPAVIFCPLANAASEDATVFIEVQIQTTDARGRPVLTKVSEGSGFLVSETGWVLTAAHLTKIETPPNAKLVFTGAVRSRFN